MKKTIKQRFFLSLCLLMLFSLFGGGNLAWAQGTDPITLANGTYKNGTIVWEGNCCTITQAKGKSSTTVNSSYIAKPRWYKDHVITFAAKKGYTLTGVTIVATSVEYANALSESTYSSGASASVSGTKVTITTSGDFSVTMSAQSRMSSITVSYVANNEPALETNSDGSLSFGNVETSSNKQLSFTLSGRNLTADATLSITGTDKGYFSVAPASVSPTEGTIAETDVTVTYTPTAVGTHNATLTIASSGATTKEIALSGTGIAPLPFYTVSWKVNGVPYTTGDPSTSVKSGERVTALPTEPAAIGTKKFVGWTNAEIAAAQPTAPTVLFTTPEDAPAVTGNVTYHAVFATQSDALTEVLSQTLAYDTWTYGGSTTDKGTSKPSYRLFHEGGYVQSKSFDLSTLSKVVVYGGTFGGDGNNTLEIGDGTNIWKTVTVSGSSQTGKNIFTDGSPLSGEGVLKITSQSGTTSDKGVRISKILIYTLAHSYSDYCTTIPDVQLSVGKTGYATLYYSNFDLVVPENTEAYTFRSENGALMESATYAAGTVIPAGEAVVVYTTNAVPCTLNFRKFIANVARDASSQLAGTDEETKIASDEAYYFYGLSLNSSNDLDSVGFYWMNEDGSAFTNGANKAYLKILKSGQSVRGFAFKGTTTGVESVESSNNAPQAIYDLTGRRVSKAEKGIYIINGKKVIK